MKERKEGNKRRIYYFENTFNLFTFFVKTFLTGHIPSEKKSRFYKRKEIVVMTLKPSYEKILKNINPPQTLK